MSNYSWNCPKCNYKVTENDFEENGKIYNQILNRLELQKEKFKQELLIKLRKEEEEKFSNRLKLELTTLENKKDAQYADKIKSLEKDKTELEITNKSFKEKIEQEKKLASAEQEKKDQQIITQRDQTIAELNKNLETTKSKLALELNTKFNSKIAELNKQLIELEITNKSFKEKNEQEKKLASAEQEKKDQQIITQRDQTIVDLNNKLKLEKANLDAEKSKLELELQKNFDFKISELKEEIQNLKLLNEKNKIIQNKTKGENFEQEVHGELTKCFDTEDVISKITDKNQKGDFLQEVRVNKKVIGKIVYEVKNAEWKDKWETKLLTDMAAKKAKFGILIATSLNTRYPEVPFKKSDSNDNIYFANPDSFIFVAQLVKIIIKKEYDLELLRQKEFNNNKSSDRFVKYKEWVDTQWPKLIQNFSDNFTRLSKNEDIIKKSANSILKSSEEIRIARENMANKQLKDIEIFITKLDF
ncbi:DUF2130 domain-containing protein [Spiroplasma endosymbiont of Amphibalanus improvisus]|uniref:DUF2130 domain-containing protein n=1 Tax=Spiroplasma endosymbiont of Amphibalanus improvisus TaxID=3066327 RepID=UPI00313E6198